jgi:hypothetical protein
MGLPSWELLSRRLSTAWILGLEENFADQKMEALQQCCIDNNNKHTSKDDTRMGLPSINVVKDLIGPCLTVCLNKIFVDPGDEVILECAFYELMQQIRCDKGMDIGVGEVICERLQCIRWRRDKDEPNILQDLQRDHTHPKEHQAQVPSQAIPCVHEIVFHLLRQDHSGVLYIYKMIKQTVKAPEGIRKQCTVDTSPVQCKRGGLAQDSRQCMAQGYR